MLLHKRSLKRRSLLNGCEVLEPRTVLDGDTLGTAQFILGAGSGHFNSNFTINDSGSRPLDVDIFEISTDLPRNLSAFTAPPPSGTPLGDSILRVFDEDGNELARDDDGGVGTYSRIDILLPSPGTYYVGVSGYANFNYDPNVANSGTAQAEGRYNLDVSLEAGDTLSLATRTKLDELGGDFITSGEQIGDGSSVALDVDLYQFFGKERQRITAFTSSSDGTTTDTVLRLFDAAGNELARDDDAGAGTFSAINDFALPATGFYYFGVSGFDNFNYDPSTRDSGVSQDLGTYQLNVHSNVVPALTNLGGSVNFVEDSGGVRIAPNANVVDFDSPDFDGGRIVVRYDQSEPEDQLFINETARIQVSGTDVRFDGVLVGTITTGGRNGGPLVVTFNANADAGIVGAILRNVTYNNTSQNPDTTPRVLSIRVSDGDGGGPGTAAFRTKQVNIIAVNDRPLLGGIFGRIGYRSNSSPIAVASSATVTDVDSRNFSGGKFIVRATEGRDASNRISLGGSVFTVVGRQIRRQGVTIGTLNANAGVGTTNFIVTLTGHATPNVVQQLARAIRFQTVGNTSSTDRILAFSVTDGDGGTSPTRTVRVVI